MEISSKQAHNWESQKERAEEAKEIFEEIMTECFLKMKKYVDPQIQEARQIPQDKY